MSEPKRHVRPETGPMEFKNDWPGVFIRGDNAAHYAFQLQNLLEEFESKTAAGAMAAMVCQDLVNTLTGCIVGSDGEIRAGSKQEMRTFEDCAAPR